MPPLPRSCSSKLSCLGVGPRFSNSESTAGESGAGDSVGDSGTPRTGRPRHQAFLSLSSRGGKSKFRVPAIQGPRRSLPDSQKATFSPCPHVAESELRSPCHGSPTLRTSFSPHHPQRPICTHHCTGARASVSAAAAMSVLEDVFCIQTMALHRSLVPSCPTAWLTEQVTSWGASCLLRLSWRSNPRALESGQAGLEVGLARASLAS